jgi:hypothetical protein
VYAFDPGVENVAAARAGLTVDQRSLWGPETSMRLAF